MAFSKPKMRFPKNQIVEKVSIFEFSSKSEIYSHLYTFLWQTLLVVSQFGVAEYDDDNFACSRHNLNALNVRKMNFLWKTHNWLDKISFFKKSWFSWRLEHFESVQSTRKCHHCNQRPQIDLQLTGFVMKIRTSGCKF